MIDPEIAALVDLFRPPLTPDGTAESRIDGRVVTDAELPVWPGGCHGFDQLAPEAEL